MLNHNFQLCIAFIKMANSYSTTLERVENFGLPLIMLSYTLTEYNEHGGKIDGKRTDVEMYTAEDFNTWK